MKLKNRNETPVGGFYYDEPTSGRPIVTDGNFDKLVAGVKQWYLSRGEAIPDKIESLIEDQICTRQPEDKCWYTKGTGDQLSRAIHKMAGAVDKVLGTNLKKKARSCGKCSKRRVMIN